MNISDAFGPVGASLGCMDDPLECPEYVDNGFTGTNYTSTMPYHPMDEDDQRNLKIKEREKLDKLIGYYTGQAIAREK